MSSGSKGIEARLRMKHPGFTLDVSLKLPGRGVSALFGPSGSGKTSCLRCIAGLERNAAGLVEINGERGPLDVKTGKEKPSMRLQLTGLSMCDWHAEAGMEAERMPVLDDVGWILLLRPDGYDLVRHEISKADRDHFVHLVGTYHKIREWAATFTPTASKEVAA